MACTSTKTTRTRARKAAAAGPQVVDSTFDQDDAAQKETADTIAIACCLPHGLVFRDIPDGKGGTKTIRLPGINQQLKGAAKGVLALPGNALCVTMARADWEALKETHGREDAFVGVNGGMPCIYPVGDRAGFKDAKASGEIAEMQTGLEAADPNANGVEAAAQD